MNDTDPPGTTMERNTDQFDGTPATATKNAAEALRRLHQLAFWDETWADSGAFDFPSAAEHFNKEQPLTVRGAFYRAVSAGLFSDTSDPHYNASRTANTGTAATTVDSVALHRGLTRRRLKPSSWVGLKTSPKLVHAHTGKTCGRASRTISSSSLRRTLWLGRRTSHQTIRRPPQCYTRTHLRNLRRRHRRRS
jgi:hypothetical protein